MEKKALSGIMLTMLFIGMLTSAFNIQPVKANGTIYIRADGSVDPPDAPISSLDNITYTLVGNIYDEIVVERDNIIIDGGGYTVQGTGSGTGSGRGIYLREIKNVTIENVEVKAFGLGIGLWYSSNNSIVGNNLTNNGGGISLGYSSNNSITGNNIANNGAGIGLYLYSLNNSIVGNTITNSGGGIDLDYSSNNNIIGNNITNNSNSIDLWDSSNNNSIVENDIKNNSYGINLYFSSNNNSIVGNNITANDDGISLYDSSNNNIVGNNLANEQYGISLGSSSNNSIVGNNVTANGWDGIRLSGSSNNSIVGNTITNSGGGISLWHSSNNSMVGNNVTNNVYGRVLYDSSNNIVYHNNFISNQQAYSSASINVWDDGYPSGGNYWSDYAGVDVKSGPNQDQPSSDGISDTSYIIDLKNIDHYPLMNPWGTPPPPTYTLTVYSLPSGVTFTVSGIPRTTPWSGTYTEGTSVCLVMPETHGKYVWSYWLEDGDTDATKIFALTNNTMWTALFVFPGDINDDGIVDILDVVIWANSFGSKPGDTNWNPLADLNQDRSIDIFDAVIIGVNFGKTL